MNPPNEQWAKKQKKKGGGKNVKNFFQPGGVIWQLSTALSLFIYLCDLP